MPDQDYLIDPYAEDVPAGWAEFVEAPGAEPPPVEPQGLLPFEQVPEQDPELTGQDPEPDVGALPGQEPFVSLTPEESGWAQLVGAVQEGVAAVPEAMQGTVGDLTEGAQEAVAAQQPVAEAEAGYRTLGDFEPPRTPQEAMELQVRQAHAAQVRADQEYIRTQLEIRKGQAKAVQELQAIQLNHQRRSMELQRQYEELANQAPDPGRWWSNASTGQKIGAAMAAVFGGMLQGFQGGPNRGLETVFRYIEQDIDSQRDAMFSQRESLQAQRMMLADETDRSGDLVRTAWSMKLASLAHMDKELAARQRLYDPEGSLNAALAKGRQEIALKQIEWTQKANKDLLDDQVKVAELRIKEIETQIKAAELTLKAQKTAGKGKALGAFTYGPEVDPEHMTGVWHVNPDGSRTAVKAKNPDAGKKFSELAMPTRVILDLFPDLHEMRKQADAEGLPGELNLAGHGGELQSRMRSAHATLFTELRRVAGTGANLTEQEIKEIWKEAGKDATTWAQTRHIWEQTERQLRRKINEHARDASGDETVIFDMAFQPRAREGLAPGIEDPAAQKAQQLKMEAGIRERRKEPGYAKEREDYYRRQRRDDPSTPDVDESVFGPPAAPKRKGKK